MLAQPAKPRILEATSQLLDQKSSQFFSLQDVAAIADVSPSLIIRHFKSKDELVFQCIMQDLEMRDMPELERQHANGAFATIRDLIAYLAYSDIERGHRTRDLMTMSWWWMEEEEAQFRRTLFRRRAIAKELLARDLPDDSGERVLDDLTDHASMLYLQHLRTALVHRWGSAQAIAAISASIDRLLETQRILYKAAVGAESIRKLRAARDAS